MFKAYAITEPTIYTDLARCFSEFKRLKLASFVLFRDKFSKNYDTNALVFMKQKPKLRAKFILHNNIDLAMKLGADGIHFSSLNLDDLQYAPKSLIKFASTHNLDEIKKANSNGADFITFSPIFFTPNKGAAVGLDALIDAIRISKVPVFALGGVVNYDRIKAVKKVGAFGFASISYFAN